MNALSSFSWPSPSSRIVARRSIVCLERSTVSQRRPRSGCNASTTTACGPSTRLFNLSRSPAFTSSGKPSQRSGRALAHRLAAERLAAVGAGEHVERQEEQHLVAEAERLLGADLERAAAALSEGLGDEPAQELHRRGRERELRRLGALPETSALRHVLAQVLDVAPAAAMEELQHRAARERVAQQLHRRRTEPIGQLALVAQDRLHRLERVLSGGDGDGARHRQNAVFAGSDQGHEAQSVT